MRPDCAIAVMAKAPQSGRSKTRLCPPLTPDLAADLSGAFLRDTTENMAAAARNAAIARYAAYAPVGTQALLAAHLAAGTRPILADGSITAPEGVTGFGACLLHAMRQIFARHHSAACVLSSDTPTLPTRLLVQAAALLLDERGRGQRIVFGPCEDGGYYLLGMTSCHASLFSNIAWSTDGVADATRARARQAGLEMVELDTWYDVDDATSLGRLADDTEGYAAPFTRRTMARLGINAVLA